MSSEKRTLRTGRRFLSVLCKGVFLRKSLPDLEEGICHLCLECEETGLSSDLELDFQACLGRWKYGEKFLSETGPFYFVTPEKEQILLLLSERMESIASCRKIFMKAGEQVKIGKAYTNRIFYDCFSLVGEIHAEIIQDGKDGVIITANQEGVYVNERELKGTGRLRTGDRIDLYGLHIMILGRLLVCISFCGILRVAEDRDFWVRPEYCPGRQTQIRENSMRFLPIERSFAEKKALCCGEVEVLLPEKMVPEKRQPFLLSIGPSLTMILPMLLMAQMAEHSMGEAGAGFYSVSVAMSGCTAFLAVFWGLVNQAYGRYRRRREEREKEKQYREYLRGMERRLSDCQEKNRSILQQRYPKLCALTGEKEGRALVLWNRYYRQRDFLFLRLGEGEMSFQVHVKLSGKKDGIVQGKLSEEAREMAERFALLTRVPAGVDLFEKRQMGIIRDMEGEKVLLQLLLQIAACHCYTEVKIACFYRKDKALDRKIADCVRWLPHCWSAGRRVRFLAGNEREADEILPALTGELIKGIGGKAEEIRIPWYVVIVLDQELIAGESLYQYLTERNIACPVSGIFVEKTPEALPKSCRYFLCGKKEELEILDLEGEQPVRKVLTPDECCFWNVQSYARRITGLCVREREGDELIPEKVDFLQLYGCRRVGELESGRRWQRARPEERLKALVGYRAGGIPVYLDIHEKFHGPHGLVAGTTGSGKSELLQTYLLSMAVSYSPADVNFFMIDYKGGGTGNILKELPHCAGMISNLSGKQIGRAMSAISSENRRRQKLLSKYQVNHIDAYSRLRREGKAGAAMPHLILVVDEFAELKKEAPEFMQEIISLAQVGRSLGIHLILATQKPAGIVDDKIWSNARFRLCLRVQDRQDSMDMLRNGDAATLTAPGRCYIQIGNHEYYELFQAAYCGGPYQEGAEERIRAALLGNTGKRRERKQEFNPLTAQSQIQALVDYIRQTGERFHYSAASQLWMPELPDLIVTEDLKEKKPSERETGEIRVILGLCDDPENQRQFVFIYQPLVHGHLAVFGGPGTGKTTFLQNVLWQLCHEYGPQQALILAVSPGQESFGCFWDMPGCIGVLKDERNLEVFFYHLKKLADERRRKLSGTTCEQYNRHGKDKLPCIFLMIDNMGGFEGKLGEEQQELILNLAGEGISLGIYLILSASDPGELGGRLFEKIKFTVAFELNDRFQYGDVLRQYYLPVLPQANRKGRGLCKIDGRVVEFQGAVALGEKGDYERMDLIAQRGKEMEREMQRLGEDLPEKFPVLPEKPVFDMLVQDRRPEKGKIPLGYSFMIGEPYLLSLAETTCFLISGIEKTGRNTLMTCMIEGYLLSGGEAVVIDGKGRFRSFLQRKGVTLLSDDGEVEEWERTVLYPNERGKPLGVFIGDIGDLCCKIYQSGARRDERTGFWEQLAAGRKDFVFLAAIYHPVKDVEAAGTKFFREFTAWQYGICLGGNLASQRIFDFDDLSYMIQSRYEAPGTGYLKQGPGSGTEKLLLPVYWRDAEGDLSGYSGSCAGAGI